MHQTQTAMAKHNLKYIKCSFQSIWIQEGLRIFVTIQQEESCQKGLFIKKCDKQRSILKKTPS